jgi:hypothetical protein
VANGPSNFFAFYVNNISDPPQKDKKILGFSNAGFALDPAMIAAVPIWPFTPPIAPNIVQNVTAHEMGHILGLGEELKVLGIADPNNGNTMIHDPNSRGAAYLMLTDHPNSTPCSLSRDDWNIINFTRGTKILGEDGKAH